MTTPDVVSEQARRMFAAHTVGEHLKAVTRAARGSVDPLESFRGGTVRDHVLEMRRADLEDAYSMLLEIAVLHQDRLACFGWDHTCTDDCEEPDDGDG